MRFSDFMNAIERENFEGVKEFFKPEFINKKKDECTPLHWACMYNQETKIVKFLLGENSNIEEKSVHEMRCIHLSVMRGNVKVLKALIKNGCSLVSLTKTGKSALDLAKESKNKEFENILKAAKRKQPITKEKDQLNKYYLTKIMDMQIGKTLLDELLYLEDPRIIDAIKEKPVDDKEIKRFHDLGKTKVNLQSYRLIQECLLARCIIHKYDNGIYDLCTADMVNRESLFMGPTALELAVECEVSVITFNHILRKLVKADESWRKAENIARRKNQGRILSLIEERREYLKSQENNILRVATIENDTDLIKYIFRHHLVNEEDFDKMIDDAKILSGNIGHNKCTEILEKRGLDDNNDDEKCSEAVTEEGLQKDHGDYSTSETGRGLVDEDLRDG